MPCSTGRNPRKLRDHGKKTVVRGCWRSYIRACAFARGQIPSTGRRFSASSTEAVDST